MNAIFNVVVIINVIFVADRCASANYHATFNNGFNKRYEDVNMHTQHHTSLEGRIEQPVDHFGIRNEFQRLAKKIQEAKNDMYLANFAPREFRFKRTDYKLTTTAEYVGLLKQFAVVSSTALPIQFGLCSDDVYVNKVFRVGPVSGILYADTEIKPGVYYFNITADVTSVQLHAEANVTVNVTERPVARSFLIEAHSIAFILGGNRIHPAAEQQTPIEPIIPERTDCREGKLTPSLTPEIFGEDVTGDVETNEIIATQVKRFWNDLLRGNFKAITVPPKPNDEKHLEDIFEPRPPRPLRHQEIKLVLPEGFSNNIFRNRRGIPHKIPTSAPIAAAAKEEIVATAPSHVIFHETAFADFMMSAFVLFVITFASVVFFGSLVYFAYKRLKKCGDYAVDEDVKSIDRPADDDIVMQGDMKNPNMLCVTEINQKNVVDSIVITKAKLNHGPGTGTVFTIQKSYEQEPGDEDKVDDDVFVMDMSQVTAGSENEYYNTVTLQTFTVRTPAITATLISDQPTVSILSSSRRNSVSSNVQSVGSGDTGPNGEVRRKSVTFSDIVELYQIKKIATTSAT